MINGEFALILSTAMLMMLKLQIIIEVIYEFKKY